MRVLGGSERLQEGCRRSRTRSTPQPGRMPLSVATSEHVVCELVNRQESLPEPAACLKAPVPPVNVSVPWSRSLLLLPESRKVP